MTTTNISILERKLARLERLQCMNTSFQAVASSLEGYNDQNNSSDNEPLDLSPAVQKSMELRRSSSSSSASSPFAEKLKLSQELSTRERQLDAKMVLVRVRECHPSALAETLSAARKKRQAEEEEKKQVDNKDNEEEEEHDNQSLASSAADALHNLRGILEEQKRRSVAKRQRLHEIRRTNEAAEKGMLVPERVRSSLCSKAGDDVSIITTPSMFVDHTETSESSPGGGLEGLSIELGETFSIPVITEEETIEFSKDVDPSENDNDCFVDGKQMQEDNATTLTAEMSEVSSFDEEEASQRAKLMEDMKYRVRALEEEKLERAATLSSFLVDYRARADRLEKENERIQDASSTTYCEMKTLLVEQSHESEYLRDRLSTLEKRSKTTKTVSSIFLLFFFCFTVGVTVALNQTYFFPKGVTSTWNGLCAPVEPSSQITEETGLLEAPWWAPEGPLKEPLFHLAGCGSRPRLQMEIKRGMLHLTDLKDDTVVMKKASNAVYAEADTIQIMARQRGGHNQMDAPWALEIAQ